MNSPKRLLLILGDQLDLNGAALRAFDIKTDEIVMIESIPEAQYVWSHRDQVARWFSALLNYSGA
jgi:deoxyribodipyrimidine photolyase-related protein